MKVYIAATFESLTRLRPVRDALQQLGHVVVSSWLDEEPAPVTAESIQGKEAFDYALRDTQEVRKADTMILDTLDVNDRGGSQVEWGYALALGYRKMIRVGPVRNIFHQYAMKAYPDWQSCLADIAKNPYYGGKK